MINLRNDYCFIAHDEILKALEQYNNMTFVGYGLDEVSKEAKELIKKEINNQNVDVHFLPGGTVTNKVLISHLLRPYECVISCDSGHIAVHETGTIEQSGHKVLTVPNYEGKIKAEFIKNENKLIVFADHCKNYTEVDDVNDDKKEPVNVYDNWRLPTAAELKIIMDIQGTSGQNADAIDYLLNGGYYMSASGPVFNSKNSDDTKELADPMTATGVAIRCVRDVY